MIRLPPRRPVFGGPDAGAFAAPAPHDRHVIGGDSALDDAREGFLTASDQVGRWRSSAEGVPMTRAPSMVGSVGSHGGCDQTC